MSGQDEKKSRATRVQVENLPQGAPLWFIGWLFMIGYVQPSLWQALLGIVLWPYFLGASMR